MKVNSLILALTVISSSSAVDVAASSSPLWPKPVSEQLGTSQALLSPDFSFTSSSQASPFLDQAAARYHDLIFPPSSSSSSSSSPHSSSPSSSGSVGITSCDLQVTTLVADERATLLLGVDESYELSVSAEGVCRIYASTVWGALHAMESFTQLLTREGHSLSLDYLPVTISDAARYSHRGLLIDSSRHFLPLSDILLLIDTLPMSKFNVLHCEYSTSHIITVHDSKVQYSTL
jgi:hexosaminidase